MATTAEINTALTDLGQGDVDTLVAAAAVSDEHQARFCAIWNVAGPILDELRQVIPGVGPLIIGMLERIGDRVYEKHGCVPADRGDN